MSKAKSADRIPGNAEWAGYQNDPATCHAHELFFGKAIDEVLRHFGDAWSIERADELLFMPRHAFQYYVFAFAKFVMSDAAAGDPDSASTFLRLLMAREKRDPGSVAQIYPQLLPAVEYAASHQEHFGASPDIYGHFPVLAAELKEICEAPHVRSGR